MAFAQYQPSGSAGGGDATAANQTTIIGHVDGVETLIGTTNTNTGASTTALQIVDDWDESDRAKVNPIAGQAGVAAGAGAASALTQRVILASDDPAVVDLAAIEVLITTVLERVDGLETLLNAGLPAALAADGGLKSTPATVESAVDAAVNTTPVYTGGIHETTPTVVETGDKAAMHFDVNQALLTANMYDPCSHSARTTLAINQTDSAELIAASGTTKIYVCSGVIVTAGDDTIQFAEGTGTTCGTSQGLLSGVISVPADGSGFLIQPFSTNTAGEALCILQGASADIDGYITYVQK